MIWGLKILVSAVQFRPRTQQDFRSSSGSVNRGAGPERPSTRQCDAIASDSGGPMAARSRAVRPWPAAARLRRSGAGRSARPWRFWREVVARRGARSSSWCLEAQRRPSSGPRPCAGRFESSVTWRCAISIGLPVQVNAVLWAIHRDGEIQQGSASPRTSGARPNEYALAPAVGRNIRRRALHG